MCFINLTFIGDSSKGRIADFESVRLGSIPRSPVFFVKFIILNLYKMNENIHIYKWDISQLDTLIDLEKEFTTTVNNKYDDELKIDYFDLEDTHTLFKNYLTEDRSLVLFAEDTNTNEIVWFLNGYTNPFLSKVKQGIWSYLDGIYIKDTYRSKGIWKELVWQFVKRSKDNWCDHIRLLVDAKNEQAIRLYKQFLHMSPEYIYMEWKI